MLYKTSLFFLIISSILLSSCYSTIPQSYFVPHEGNALKLQEKNDLSVSGSILNSSGFVETFDPILGDFGSYTVTKKRKNFQAAYSPINHLGVFGFHSRLRSVDQDNATLYHNSHLTGIGVGTYYNFKFAQRPPHKVLEDREVKYNKILFDLYGGYALGRLENQYYGPSGNTKMDYQKFYLQAGLHWEGSNWGFSYVHKVGKANYIDGIINGKPDNRNDNAIQSILNKNNLTFQEVSVQINAKVNGFGLYLQSTSGNIREFRNTSIPNPISTFGVVVDIHEVRKSLKK